jgi:hypothetical protein
MVPDAAPAQPPTNSDHPSALNLRLFTLNLLKERTADRLETHTQRCDECAGAVARGRRSHDVIRTDLRRHGLSSHAEPTGPVSLWIVANGTGWSFRVIGHQLSVGGEALDRSTAIRNALVAFATAFPAHDCQTCQAGVQTQEPDAPSERAAVAI